MMSYHILLPCTRNSGMMFYDAFDMKTPNLVEFFTKRKVPITKSYQMKPGKMPLSFMAKC